MDARALPIRLGMLLVTIAGLTQWSPSQQSETIVITEPGIYKLADFFKRADIVALVKTVSGDTESYNVAVYKAELITSFKGMQRERRSILAPMQEPGSGGNTLYFCITSPNPSNRRLHGTLATELFTMLKFLIKAMAPWSLPTNVFLTGRAPHSNVTTV